MTLCLALEFATPKKVLLRGLWLGPRKPKQVIIFIHGLGGSMWSRFHILQKLADRKTAVLTFSNRGHDKVASLARASKGRHASILGGAAHEVFIDCVDDIQGAVNFARKQSVKNIYLAGHSTGCQKSIYWASKTGGRNVKGIVLLAPVSDYAAALAKGRGAKLARLTKEARTLVRSGKKHQLMQSALNDGSQNDAQRFLSLNTPDSKETIFSYEQKGKQPRTLHAVKKPILVLWAEKDEYADRPAKEIAAWFEQNIKAKHKIVIIPGVKHSFHGAKKRVASAIKAFIAIQ